ncbi:lytic transglycosylase domain-containing protein [Rhodococcoides fascians]|uniref:lytic transglycosylase domain-containing protein n=1 Tax=Rhodococcoides fascians TaxID=1828 RepID=UPI0012D30836|nr:transglycosylase SLT domain-containing protein [Rhodococcus fascians]
MAVTYSVSSAKLPIVPDLTGFHRKVKQQLRAERVEAPVVVVPDFSRFARELETGLGRFRAEIDVEVRPDLTGFRAAVDAATAGAGGNITIPIDLDFTAARAQLAAFRVEAARSVHADFDLDITAALAQIAALRAASAGIGGSAGGIGSIGSAASGMINPVQLATYALAALAAVNVIPLVGQLAQAAGVISLLPAAAAAAAASIATIVVGSTGIFDAFKAGSKAAEDASKDAAAASKAQAAAQKQVESAARGVATAQAGVVRAERGVADAQKASERAQEKLTDARKDAVEQIEDLNLALKGSSLDERDAELALRRAQQRLQELGKDGQPVTALDFEEAILGVDQAKQRIDEVRERNADLRTETDAANKAGVEGSKQVVDAQESVADADLRVVDSKQALVDAQIAVADAQSNLAEVQNTAATSAATSADKYAEALANLSPNARTFIEDVRNLGGAWKDLRLEVQDNLFDGLGTSITELAERYFPVLESGLGGIATEINGGLRRALDDLGSESSQLDWTKIFENTRQAIGPLMDGLSDLFGSLTNIAAIGSEFLPGFGDSFSDVMKEFREFTESEEGQNKIRTFMENSIKALGEIKDLFISVGRVVGGLFSTSEKNGKSMIQSMTDGLNEFADWLNSEEGKQRMAQFWDDAQQTAKDLLHLTGEAIKLADKVAGLFGGNYGLTVPNRPEQGTNAQGEATATTGEPLKYQAGIFPGVKDGSIGDSFLSGFGGLDDFFAGDAWNFLNAEEGEPPFQASLRMGGIAVDALKEKAGELATGLLTDIGGTAVGAWDSLTTKVGDVKTSISDRITEMKESALSLKDDLAQKLSDAGISWGTLGTAVQSTITTMIDTAFPGLTGGLSSVQTFFGNVVDGIGRKWGELKDLAAAPINWIIDTVINGTLKNAWNAVADVIPGLSPWDGVARIENPQANKDAGNAVKSGYATGGIIPGYTPGRDPYTIGVSGGEAIMRPEWQRAMGPNYINAANKVARTQGVDGVRKMQRDANFAFGGVVDESLWTAVSGAFPNATLNSAYRPGASGYHGKGQAIDVGGPMQQVADWAVSSLGNKLAQVIWGPGPLLYNVGGNSITDQAQLRNSVYAGDIPGHYDHLHIAADQAVDGTGGGVVSDAGSTTGGLFNSLRSKVADQVANLFEKPLNALGGQIPDFGNSKIGTLPKAAYDELKTKAVDFVRSKVAGTSDSASGLAPGGALIGTADEYRPLVERLFDEKGIDRGYVDKYLYQLQRESTFNPNAINTWDVNAQNGTPSKGIAQVIDPTFQSYKDPGHDDIWNPEDNIRASLNYLLKDPKFGGRGVGALTGAGYDSGGIFPNGSVGWNTSGKPEAVLTNTQWELFKGFNQNLGNFATGGIVDPNAYALQRLAQLGGELGGIAKSAAPEYLGIEGSILDPNHRYYKAAMDIGQSVASSQMAAQANYGAPTAPSSTAIESPVGPDFSITIGQITGMNPDDVIRQINGMQQRQMMRYGGRS